MLLYIFLRCRYNGRKQLYVYQAYYDPIILIVEYLDLQDNTIKGDVLFVNK